MSTERQRIELLARIFQESGASRPLPLPHLECGIGDDAAILRGGDGRLVWTIDTSVEGVHFKREWLSFRDIGYRATMAAASDLAAMGATPLGLLSSLILPGDFTDSDLALLAQGQHEASRAINTAVMGGNLAKGRELSITTTALGQSNAPLRRDGAQPGDGLWIAGDAGLAAAGLDILRRQSQGHGNSVDALAAKEAVQAWKKPAPQIEAGLHAVRSGAAHAAIDISDGLACDLGHMMRESNLVAVLDRQAIVTDVLRAVSDALGRAALHYALFGGEDYALVVAANQSPGPSFRKIGECQTPREHGERPGSGVTLAGDETKFVDERLGFDHFR